MFVRNLIVVGLSALIVASFAATASAQSSCHAAVIKNDTGVTISFQIKIDNGTWTTYTIRPGQSLNVSKPHPSLVGNHSVLVRYDSIANDNRLTFHTQTLKMYVAAHPSGGWLQTFIRANSGRNLVLAG